MSPIAVSADKRFHRAHTKPARRRGRLKTLIAPLLRMAVFAAVAAIVVYRGGAFLSSAPMLQIDRVVVHGNQRVSSGAVLAALNGLRGENIVLTDLDRWRDRLRESPWIRDATFRRSLPSTIDVSISEREPIGIARVKGRLFLVDERGAAIDDYGPQYADFDLPIIDGLLVDADPDSVAGDVRGELASRLIMALRAKPSLARRLSQVDVTNAHNAAVILNGDPAVIFVGEDRFLPRLESYLGLSAALRERVADIDYVDLRFDDRIYVRPLGRDGRPAPMRTASGPARVSRSNTQKR